ncbi:MAG: AAA family ATPase, partial [Bacteroidota bacterium]|nr:AAA family ATPase [Bacteroidota bacterium]
MKKRLALGHQEFSEVIGNNCIYVDKTENIYKLVTEGSHYFISRPRRFGKSLLANTLKELYLGNKELFKGLWIYDKWDWNTTYPVIKLSFSLMDYEELGLKDAINDELDKIAKKYNIVLTKKTNGTKFEELIIKLSTKSKVAIIIDEYDKPIIDYMDNIPQATENRKILKNFYSVLKDSDSYMKFFFVTGVSKFAKVSIFSDLNNLVDITIDKNYSQIVGWTIKEIKKYFSDYIKEIAKEYKDIYSDIIPEIKKWYNGYSWDGVSRLYNPVSLMNFFQKRVFGNYWFKTGTPTMLMDIIKTKKLTPFDIENTYISTEMLDKYDFNDIHFESLLFQTGYLTIKEYDILCGEITLDYPNKEVAKSFSAHILSELTSGELNKTDNLLHKIRRAFLANEIDKFIEYVNIMFRKIPYTILENKEKYFHSLFYLIIKILGFQIEAETLTIDGRIDAVVKTKSHIYIIEFKINQTAEKAIQQIIDKKYALKYADDKRLVLLIGINFDTENKIIEDW